MITDMTMQRTLLDYLRHHTATSGPLVAKRMDFWREGLSTSHDKTKCRTANRNCALVRAL